MPQRWMLAAGIVLRILVYIFLQPLNNDDHGEVVRLIVEQHRLPTLTDTLQAQHPPLYYLMAAPVLRYTGSYKMVQLLSLWFAIGTLLTLYHLIYHTPLIRSARARTYGFLIVCFLPQFVQFSLYLSNDSLAILLGNAAILQTWRAIRKPDVKQWTLLAILTGLGMLTKLTFLAFVPVLCGLAYWIFGRGMRGLRAAAAFAALAMALGSYKLVENWINFRSPMITGLDPRFHVRFATEHQGTYRGAASWLEANVLKLIPAPVLGPATYGSYPVIFYATFWYQYIPESNFIGDRSRPWMYIGSAIYALGIPVTAVFLIGLGTALRAKLSDETSLARLVSVLLMLMTGLMFVPAVAKYHVWSIVQARYLFPAMFGCLVAFAAGVELVERSRAASRVLAGAVAGLTAMFLVYFATEIARWI